MSDLDLLLAALNHPVIGLAMVSLIALVLGRPS